MPLLFCSVYKNKADIGKGLRCGGIAQSVQKGLAILAGFLLILLLFCYIFYACVKFLASCFRQNFKKSSRVESHHECKQFLYNSCNNHLLIHQDHAI